MINTLVFLLKSGLSYFKYILKIQNFEEITGRIFDKIVPGFYFYPSHKCLSWLSIFGFCHHPYMPGCASPSLYYHGSLNGAMRRTLITVATGLTSPSGLTSVAARVYSFCCTKGCCIRCRWQACSNWRRMQLAFDKGVLFFLRHNIVTHHRLRRGEEQKKKSISNCRKST